MQTVDLVARWWNGQQDQSVRRDIWLTSDDCHWIVRARHRCGEVQHEFTREYEARAMVDKLIAAAPGNWKDITRLISRPPPTNAAGDGD